MTNEHRRTPEEEAYERLYEENEGTLSEAARSLLGEAEWAAYTEHMVHNVMLGPEEYEEAMERMCLAADRLAGRDREVLARLWRAALAAAASLDPDDRETLVKYGVYVGSLHWFYRTASAMVEEILREKALEELRKSAEREPEEDFTNLPF